MATIQFTPVESFFDPGFWSKFYDNKLEIYKLDEGAVSLLLTYTTSPHVSLPPKLNAYGEYSFQPQHQTGSQTSSSPCTLFNFNSFQSFKDSDKKAILTEQSTQLWTDMLTGKCLTTPSLLNRSFIISYADLKQYLYTHWLCIPSLQDNQVQFTTTSPNPLALEDYSFYSDKKLSMFEWSQLFNQIDDMTNNPIFIINRKESKIVPLSELTTILTTEADKNSFFSNYLFTVLDPVANPSSFSWFFRNILYYINLVLGSFDVPKNNQDKNGYTFDLLAIKNTRELQLAYQELLLSNPKSQQQQSHTSYIYQVNITGESTAAVTYMKQYRQPDQQTNLELPPTPPTIGWERYKEKLQPKQTSSKNLDPLQIYTQAGDMNLKLLKWQHWPEMPLPHIRSQKCLLIGSGTLGCYVSRLLLGWGLQHITMLDYGKVSASNPVRQPLFTFQDWQQGKHKAHAAAEALKAIHPRATINSVVLSIPSAGTVSEKELPQALDSSKQLATLIQQHDVIFLLTDSRASRWLPTLFAQAYGKRTIAAAIGPETFVAMRHGIRQGWEYTEEKNTSSLTVETEAEIGFGSFTNTTADVSTSGTISCGCYFCPDQAAPILGIPQSIDQQCTVTRAEVAALASSYAVNLFVQDVSHTCTYHLPKTDVSGEEPKSSLFETPTTCQTCELNSQVRGSVLTHVNPVVESNSLSCPPSSTCIGCGSHIVKAYQQDPVGFLTATLTDAENVTTFSGFNPEFIGGGDWEHDEWDMDGDEDNNDDFGASDDDDSVGDKKPKAAGPSDDDDF